MTPTTHGTVDLSPIFWRFFSAILPFLIVFSQLLLHKIETHKLPRILPQSTTFYHILPHSTTIYHNLPHSTTFYHKRHNAPPGDISWKAGVSNDRWRARAVPSPQQWRKMWPSPSCSLRHGFCYLKLLFLQRHKDMYYIYLLHIASCNFFGCRVNFEHKIDS